MYYVYVEKAPINICKLFSYVDEYHSYTTSINK